jgi:hypothetical protein
LRSGHEFVCLANDHTQRQHRVLHERPRLAFLFPAPLLGRASGTDCTETYCTGSVVILRAHPGVKSYFVGWSGDCVSTGTLTAQVTMNADKHCIATFGYPVGGIVVPVSKLGLVAPWMSLPTLAGLAALGAALVRRRRS